MSLQAICADRLLTPFEEISQGIILVEDQTILAVGHRGDVAIPPAARLVELGKRIVTPGFIDIHIHGGAGHDVMEASDPALFAVSRHLARSGTTSFIPTTVSAPLESLEKALVGLADCISRARLPRTVAVAEPLGIHLEGPFISQTCRGAHPSDALLMPSLEIFDRLLQAAAGQLKIMTIAPELPGAAELQAHAQQACVKIGLGHSHATCDQARAAIGAGATHGVHVFNAMRPFAHREPGILGALLTDERVMAEIIADGVHVAPPAVQLLVKAKGAERTILVTDALSAAGMEPGRYRLGSMEIEVRQDQSSGRMICRNAEGTLAGSLLTLQEAIGNVMQFAGVPLAAAVRMATANPAQLLGIGEHKGRLAYGTDADLAILDASGQVAGVMTRGQLEIF